MRQYSRFRRNQSRGHRLRGPECLEDRLALDAEGGVLFGVDPHFTLSFANDGTSVLNEVSGLYAQMQSLAPEAVWKEQLLRAFQTWAVLTNADIGVVADGGQAFGAAGEAHRDPRFGDIRVGSLAADPQIGAVSVPVDSGIAGTWTADVLFNSSFAYTTLDQLLAVAMHEAGNVFGLADSSDPDSPLYSGAAPTVRQPTAADISALQALHGVRAPDGNEVHSVNGSDYTDNDSTQSAYALDWYDSEDGDSASAPTIVYGDITTTDDVDHFALDIPNSYEGALKVTLRTAGISLLMPHLSIVDQWGGVVDFASSSAAGGDVLTLDLVLEGGEQLFVRVDNAVSDIFGIGGYSLVVTLEDRSTVDQSLVDQAADGRYRFLPPDEIAKLFDSDDDDFFNDDMHSDDDDDFGLELETAAGYQQATRYKTLGSITDTTDIDYYSLKSPQSQAAPLTTMTIAVRSFDVAGLIPQVQLWDDDNNPISATVIANGVGQYVIQATVSLDQDYIVSVSAAVEAGDFSTGNYSLDVSFQSTPVDVLELASGTVGGLNATATHTMYIGEPQLVHFLLDAGAGTATSAMLMQLRDAAGAIVMQLATPAGETRSNAAVYLAPGTYTATFAAIDTLGGAAAATNYTLRGVVISDPFTGDPNDPTNNPFACPEPGMTGVFCYPSGHSPDPIYWEGGVDYSTTAFVLPLEQLIAIVLAGWWTPLAELAPLVDPPTTTDHYYVVPPSDGPTGMSGSIKPTDAATAAAPFIAVLAEATRNGSVTLDPDGSFAYTPNSGFVGVDSFDFVASNLVHAAEAQTVLFIVGYQLPGDFDHSGIVDAADRGVWLASYGSTTDLAADGNGDGVVDSGDYTAWRDNLGSSMLAGDFDFNYTVDDADAAIWRANFGATGGLGLAADANRDGVVDSADYTIWRDNRIVAVVAPATEVAGLVVVRSEEAATTNPVPLAFVSVESSRVAKISATAPRPAIEQFTPSLVPVIEAPVAIVTSTPLIMDLSPDELLSDQVPEARAIDSAFAEWWDGTSVAIEVLAVD